MSYVTFFPAVRSWGRSSTKLSPVPPIHLLRLCNRKYKKYRFRERSMRRNVRLHHVIPQPIPQVTLNIRVLRKVYFTLESIHDLCHSRVKVKTKHIRNKWGIKLWGSDKISGRYQAQWCAGNYI